MILVDCANCSHLIQGDAQGRLPPWCPKCGTSLKATPGEQMPAALDADGAPAGAAQHAPLVAERNPKLPAARGYIPGVSPDQPPYFLARATFTWKTNRCYRVYLLPQELLFLEAGPDRAANGGVNPSMIAAAGVLGGLLGGLIVGMVAANQRKQSDVRQRELDYADTNELIRMVDGPGQNFRVSPIELLDARLDPPTFWHQLNYAPDKCAGLFRFRHSERGSYTMEIPTLRAMHLAMEHLPRILDGVLTVNAVWDQQKGRYVRGF